MVEMTIRVPDDLGQRIKPFGQWLPTVLELGLSSFKTRAGESAAEVIGFLAGAPSPEDVLVFHVSETGQNRMRRLLTLNREGLLGEEEQNELDELRQLEHIVIKLKADAATKRS